MSGDTTDSRQRLGTAERQDTGRITRDLPAYAAARRCDLSGTRPIPEADSREGLQSPAGNRGLSQAFHSFMRRR